jgi:hypothetical protein
LAVTDFSVMLETKPANSERSSVVVVMRLCCLVPANLTRFDLESSIAQGVSDGCSRLVFSGIVGAPILLVSLDRKFSQRIAESLLFIRADLLSPLR